LPTPAPTDPPASVEPVAELPAAEIADSGEPMSATVAEEHPTSLAQEPQHEHPLERPVPNAAPGAATPAIRQAIEEIYKINKDLEWVLLEMEKAVETLEEAEVQKYADEREIESLKNAMRQLNRTRETIQRVHQGGPQRHDPRGRPAPREREQRDRRFQGRQRHEPRPERRNPEPGPSSHEPPPSREEDRGAEPPPEPEIPV